MPVRPPTSRLAAAARLVVASVLIAIAAGPAAFAEDTIVLTNGNEVRGRIVSEDEDAVKIDIGGGKMTFRRSQIAEVRREKPPEATPGAAPVDAAENLAPARDEHAVLYTDGARSGTLTTRVRRETQAFVVESERAEFGPAGDIVRTVRTIERSDLEFRPVSLSVRTTEILGGKESFRSVAAEVRSGRIYVTTTIDGERSKSEAACPAEPRFAGAGREMFLRRSRALGGRFEASVFDPATLRFASVTWVEGGVRPVVVAGKSDTVRVVRRVRDGATGDEWVRPDLTTLLSDLDGGTTRALGSDARTVTLLRSGASDAAAALDAAARTTWRDDDARWTIRKPDPSWTFGSPASRADGRRLAVRNEATKALVEVSLDPLADARTTPQRAAESLQKGLRTSLEELRPEKDGFIERGGRRILQITGTARDARGPLVVVLRIVQTEKATHRLVASAPATGFEAIRGDVERLLDSFRAD